jgi:hypothetical protein
MYFLKPESHYHQPFDIKHIKYKLIKWFSNDRIDASFTLTESMHTKWKYRQARSRQVNKQVSHYTRNPVTQICFWPSMQCLFPQLTSHLSCTLWYYKITTSEKLSFWRTEYKKARLDGKLQKLISVLSHKFFLLFVNLCEVASMRKADTVPWKDLPGGWRMQIR